MQQQTVPGSDQVQTAAATASVQRQRQRGEPAEEAQAGPGSPPAKADKALPVSDQDLEYVRLAFEKGDVSRGVYRAVFNARAKFLQQNDSEPADLVGGENVDGPKTRSRKSNRVRPLNWGYTEHLDKAFGLHCFQDIVAKGIFPNVKDVSESMAALLAVKRAHMAVTGGAPVEKDIWRLDSTTCISIGDGSTPRTAGLAAFLSKWRCISVDPELKPDWVGACPRGIGRLHGACATFEDFLSADTVKQHLLDPSGSPPRLLVLLCVHSHHRFVGKASIAAVRGMFGNPPTCVVAIPCCARFNPEKDIGRPADVRYMDWAIFSHCRSVLVWKWAAGTDGAEHIESQHERYMKHRFDVKA